MKHISLVVISLTAAMSIYLWPSPRASDNKSPPHIKWGASKAVPPQVKKPIKVLVMDTGFDPSHKSLLPFLDQEHIKNNLSDYGPEVHGTHVAGIVAYGDSLEYLDGPFAACPQVRIYSCKIFKGYFYKETLAEVNKVYERCLNMALDLKVDLINVSITGSGPLQKEYEMLKKIDAAGIKVYVAAGNDNTNLNEIPSFPASYNIPWPGMNRLVIGGEKVVPISAIIPVGNMNWDGEKFPSSNYSDGLEYDYGVNIYSTMPNNRYGYLTGTSMASPMHLHRKLMELCNEAKKQE